MNMINNNLSINKNKFSFLYFNLSDLISYDDDHHTKFSLEEYYILDRFNGFFFNIRNITKSELENFVIFFGGDISMLSDKHFMSTLSFFFSLFYNQALIQLLMLYISIVELYVIFGSVRFNTRKSIFLLVGIFNKRISLEVYRFFLSFKDIYKCINFKKFKKYILSTAYFFDSDVKLYHYYYFMDSELYGNDIFVRYYSNFFDNVFYERLNFLELIEYFIDLLIYSLYNLYYINNNLIFTKNLISSTYNNSKFISARFIYNKYLNRINNFLIYFVFMHEVYTFLRLYLYLFLLLLKRSKNSKVLKKFINFFSFQFNKLLKFYYTIKYEYIKDIITFVVLLFREVKIYMYKCMFLPKKKFFYFYKFFYNFSFFFFKSFNRVKLFFFKDLLYVDYHNVFLRYNLYLLSNLRKFNSINLFAVNCLFQYNSLTVIKFTDFYKKLFSSALFSYEVKLFNFLYYYKPFFNILYKLIIDGSGLKKVMFFYNVFTPRTIENYISYGSVSYGARYFSYVWYFIDFIKKYGNLVFLSFNFSLYDVILKRFYNKTEYRYVPFIFRIKAEMEDFFFLLVEEFFGEDFEYFLDDINFEDTDLLNYHDDMEDYIDFLDDFFQDTEMCDLLFFYLVEENLSINYYIHSSCLYKYDDIYPAIQPLNFNLSWDFDLEYSKVSPFLLKRLILYGGDKLAKYIDSDMWYNWINYSMISDLYAFDWNYYNRAPEYRGLSLKKRRNRWITTLISDEVPGLFVDTESDLDPNSFDINFLVKTDNDPYDVMYMYPKNANLDYEIPADLSNWSDENYMAEYSTFNNLILLFKDIKDDPEDRTNYFGDTPIRDLVVLHDLWLWWDYVTKMSNLNFLKNKIRPRSLDELLFFNMYILSGLYILFGKASPYSRNSVNADIKFFEDMLNYFTKIKSNMSSTNLSEFDVYYHKWIDKYDELLFLNDYQDIVESMYIYSLCVNNDINDFLFKKNKEVSDLKFDSLFLYGLRIEREFSKFLMNSFKMCLLSFYSQANKGRLYKFWEDFFLNIIEITYSLLDIDEANEEEIEFGSPFWFSKKGDFDLENKAQNVAVLDEFAYSSDDDVSYIYGKMNYNLVELADSNMLIYNGLNITASFAEIMFFDLYESYMETHADTDQDFYDSSFISRLRFFEDEETMLRDKYGFTIDGGTYSYGYELGDLLYDQPFEYNVERLALESMQYANYYIGESYDRYLERFYSIYKMNFFLYGLFNSYLKRCSSMPDLGEFEVNLKIKKKPFYIDSVVPYYFVFDKFYYKLELILYYLICLFINRLRYQINFNYFIILLVFYSFVNWIRSCKFLSVRYKSLLLILLVNYFNYCFLFFLYKNKIVLSTFHCLSLRIIYDLIKYLVRKLFFFIKYFIYAYQSYFYCNIMFRTFRFVFMNIFKNENYYSFFNIFFKKVFVNREFLDVTNMLIYKYKKGASFRSFLSTYSIYINNELYNYKLVNDRLLFDYVYGSIFFHKKSKNEVKEQNERNFTKYDFFFFSDKQNLLYNVGIVDNIFLENMDILKDCSEDDYEDADKDDGYFTDEWTFELHIGDLAEDFAEDLDEEESAYHIEEVDFELSLDPLFNRLVQTEDDNHIDVHIYDDKWVWQYRFSFLFKKFYYKNLNYIRLFFINLLGLYKLKVPVTSSFSLYDNFHHFYTDYMFADKSRNEIDADMEVIEEEEEDFDDESAAGLDRKNSTGRKADFCRKFNYISDFSVYRNFFDQRMFKDFNKKDVYNILIPKFIYTFEFIDVLDYFVDLNNIEVSEFDEPYDIYNSIYGFSFIGGKSFQEYIFYYDLYKILFYIKYILLYVYIYQYIDNKQVKFVFISFFFFDLFIYLRRVLVLLFNRNKHFIKFVNIKYIFNKIYMFYYRNLYFNHTNKNQEITILGSFFPFYKFNYKIILKKIFVLKAHYTNFLSLHSYFLFIKILEYIDGFSLDKKKYSLIFKKVKNLLHLYETAIFFNAYKLALIYSKYGLNESYFFFEKLLLNKSFDLKLKIVKTNYKIIYYNLFFFEVVWFTLISLCLVLTLVEILPNIFFEYILRQPLWKKSPDEKAYRAVTFNWKIHDDQYKYLVDSSWLSLWGIF